MPTLYLDYQVEKDKILWKSKMRYQKKLYKSKLSNSIFESLLDIRIQITKNINKVLYFSVIETKKLKSYVIYKFIKNDKIVNKKKIILQIDEGYNLKCNDLTTKLNIQPKTNYELFFQINTFIKNKLMKNYDSYIKSSWIKLYINFSNEIETPCEYEEDELVDGNHHGFDCDW